MRYVSICVMADYDELSDDESFDDREIHMNDI